MIWEESHFRILKVRRKDMRRSKVSSDEICKSVSAGKGTMWRGVVGILSRPNFKVRDRREGQGAMTLSTVLGTSCQ